MLNIRGIVFVWEEFCPAPESNMPLNNEIGPIVDCHFIKISQKARLSTNWQPSSPISIMVLNYQKLTSDVGRCMYQMYWTYLKLLLFLIIFKEKVQNWIQSISSLHYTSNWMWIKDVFGSFLISLHFLYLHILQEI